MPQGYKTYRTVSDQSVYDLCLNTYGTLDRLGLLMKDNGITSVARRLPAGTSITYDTTLVNDQRFNEQGFTFATKAKVPGTLLLDLYPSAAIAVSTRKLNSNYGGPALRLRRESDSVEMDVWFNEDNNLDVLNMTQFLSGQTGYVVTWYDQSGNGNHLTQPTATRQPILYNFTLDRYAVKSDGSNDFMYVLLNTPVTRPITYLLGAKITGGAGEQFVLHNLSSTNINAALIRKLGTNRGSFMGHTFTYTMPSDMEVITVTRSTASAQYYRNNVAVTPTLTGSSNLDIARVRLFAEVNAALTTPTNHGLCEVPELVIWSSDYSPNLQAINNNMNNYFKIY
ncbi:MAG: hypothetical protein EOP56_09475 [Sphingobacteriales bacterium]|nr:MAG: hypothetical protein EOP56_09475 [Sphingobacteriales bacterium]